MLVERKSLLDVQATRKGKAPNWCFPFTARCFAAILPSFLSVRGCTSPLYLDFLGFSRPNREFMEWPELRPLHAGVLDEHDHAWTQSRSAPLIHQHGQELLELPLARRSGSPDVGAVHDAEERARTGRAYLHLTGRRPPRPDTLKQTDQPSISTNPLQTGRAIRFNGLRGVKREYFSAALSVASAAPRASAAGCPAVLALWGRIVHGTSLTQFLIICKYDR